MARITVRASILPLLQALLTAASTTLAVLLVIRWRPNRTRALPFYSDASHNDPERTLLASGENLACMFMPVVAVVEYLHHSRLLALPHRQPHVPCLPSLTSAHLVRVNFLVTALTTLFFFVTANVPSSYPATRLHQVAASALILFYALQATCKALLAYVFLNYQRDPHLDKPPVHPSPRITVWWHRHHIKLRVLLAAALWFVLLGTWLCFMGRVTVRSWGAPYQPLRNRLSACMALLVHVATVSCVTLMGVMAVDLRDERLVLCTNAD